MDDMTADQKPDVDSASLQRKRRTYSGAFKAEVVLEYIRKNNLAELAQKYDIHPNLIKNWKSALLKQAEGVLADKRRS